MPIINITQGSTVEFAVGFYDAGGNLAVPSSATLTMTYTTVYGTSVSSSIGMTAPSSMPTGGFFTANWQSGQAALGNATYSVVAPGQPKSASGLLRLLNPSPFGD